MNDSLFTAFETWLQGRIDSQIQTIGMERDNDLKRILQLEKDVEVLADRLRRAEQAERPNEFSVDDKIENAIRDLLDSDRFFDEVEEIIERSDNLKEAVRDFIKGSIRVELEVD